MAGLTLQQRRHVGILVTAKQYVLYFLYRVPLAVVVSLVLMALLDPK